MKFIVHSSKPVGKSNCNKTLIAQKRQGDKGELRQQRRTERCATFVVVRRNAEDEMGTRCTELRVSELFAALQEGFRAYSVFYESQTKELQQRLANETEDSDDSLVEEINDALQLATENAKLYESHLIRVVKLNEQHLRSRRQLKAALWNNSGFCFSCLGRFVEQRVLLL
ncbi:hypothetical protein L596_006502 [Steinernema carpocapsae]|uniref:Uncharacterized protein n=1 Tax=Steinernema carpocapsae TaxID=34508 RepID=A0A4U8V292_STECR|nr:hypothetical protein L596_006502 [Steinernema carpocapsae]